MFVACDRAAAWLGIGETSIMDAGLKDLACRCAFAMSFGKHAPMVRLNTLPLDMTTGMKASYMNR